MAHFDDLTFLLDVRSVHPIKSSPRLDLHVPKMRICSNGGLLRSTFWTVEAVVTSRDRGGVPFRIQCAHKRLPLDITPSCGVPGTSCYPLAGYRRLLARWWRRQNYGYASKRCNHSMGLERGLIFPQIRHLSGPLPYSSDRFLGLVKSFILCIESTGPTRFPTGGKTSRCLA